MSSFFKRLGRSRTNSGSYQPEDDESYERVNAQDSQGQAPPSSFRDPNQYGTASPEQGQQADSRMYSSRSSQDVGGYSSQQGQQQHLLQQQQGQRPQGMSRDSGFIDANHTPQQQQTMMGSSKPLDPVSAPDLLTAAFNAAVKPYSDRIADLESELRNMQADIRHLEQERNEVIAWIDKRGLRADVPPTLTRLIDSTPSAAPELFKQIDRKVTIVNFDLHRLQDDLNDSISSSHFAAAMLKFIPDIQRLAALPGGPRHAYEAVVKIVGNLTAHGGHEGDLDEGEMRSVEEREEVEMNRRARESFFIKFDNELASIIRGREDEGETWNVSRELKRLEKNEMYLREMGLSPYFPRSIELMRGIVGHGGVGGAGGAGGGGAGVGAGRGGGELHMQGGQGHEGYDRGGQATPPRY